MRFARQMNVLTCSLIETDLESSPVQSDASVINFIFVLFCSHSLSLLLHVFFVCLFFQFPMEQSGRDLHNCIGKAVPQEGDCHLIHLGPVSQIQFYISMQVNQTETVVLDRVCAAVNDSVYANTLEKIALSSYTPWLLLSVTCTSFPFFSFFFAHSHVLFSPLVRLQSFSLTTLVLSINVRMQSTLSPGL